MAPGKYQFHEVGLEVDWSEKSMQAVSQILESDAVNDAVGIQELTTMCWGSTMVSVPLGLEAIRYTS